LTEASADPRSCRTIRNEKPTIHTDPHPLKKDSTPADSAAVQVDLVDSKDSVDSAEELEMPETCSNLSLEEPSVLVEEVADSVEEVDELEMSVEMIWKLQSHYHSWKLLPVHLGKSQLPPWSTVNHVLDPD
jgi:hypothetical protein